MFTNATWLFVSIIFSLGILSNTGKAYDKSRALEKLIYQDTLPQLHTIKGKEISNVVSSWEDKTITVTLKNGVTHIYHWPDWEMEEYHPSLEKSSKKPLKVSP